VKPYFRPDLSSVKSQAEPDDFTLKLLRTTERFDQRARCALFPAVDARKALGRPEPFVLTLISQK